MKIKFEAIIDVDTLQITDINITKIEEPKPFGYETWKCPDCDGEMISKKGLYGNFWGCKKYPSCKGTRDSNGRSKEDREKWKQEQAQKQMENDPNIGEWKRNQEDGIRWKK